MGEPRPLVRGPPAALRWRRSSRRPSSATPWPTAGSRSSTGSSSRSADCRRRRRPVRPRGGRRRPGRRPDPAPGSTTSTACAPAYPRRRPSRGPPRRPVPRRARGDDRRGRRHGQRGRPGARPRLHPGPGAGRAPVVPRPGRPRALPGAAGVVRPAQPPRGWAGRRAGRRSSPTAPRAAASRSPTSTPSASTRSSRAVFTAVHELDVYYAEPPASWGYGQKVRTPGDVFEQRVGTCLDTTVALASCLEHLGISVRPRARLPRLLAPRRAGPPRRGQPPGRPGANAVDLGLMGVVETTMVTRERRPAEGPVPPSRPGAQGRVLRRRLVELVGVVDVGHGPAHAGAPRSGPPCPRGRGRRARRVHPGGPAGRDPRRQRDDPRTRAVIEPDPRPRASRRATAGPGLEERPPRPHPAQPAAPQPRRPDDPGATRHAEWQLGLLAQILQEGKTVSVRAVDDLAGAVAADRGRDAYALPGDVLRGMLASRSTIYSGYASDIHRGR